MRSLLCLTLLAGLLRADEGVWSFDDPPRAALRERYGFEPTTAWLTHLQRATLQVGTEWGSAAFVSADGLILTCHHTPARWIEKARAERPEFGQGAFTARNPIEEIRLPGLEVFAVESIKDVTTELERAVAAQPEPAATAKARALAIRRLESASFEATGLRSKVVSLHHGGRYVLHRLRHYRDVRLAFAPENVLFGFGDPKRVSDPRLKFDVALLRAYENGQPARPGHFLPWSQNGAAVGELTFELGIPSASQRFLSSSELRHLREAKFPAQIQRWQREVAWLQRWAATGADAARRAEEPLSVAQQMQANRERRLRLLGDDYLQARKTSEDEIRQRYSQRGEGRGEALAQAAEAVEFASRQQTRMLPRFRVLADPELGNFGGEALGFVRKLLGRASADALPPVPVALDRELEQLRLTHYLEELAEALGTDPLVEQVLGGKSPSERAAAILDQTRMFDPAWARQVQGATPERLAKERDALFVTQRIIDAGAVKLREEWAAAEERRAQGHAGWARVRREMQGTLGYPDANQTLRFGFGVVRRFADYESTSTEPSDFAGVFARSDAAKNGAPFILPESWLKARERLNLQQTLNLVTAHDSMAGSSGSALVNRQGEIVGVLFGMAKWGAIGDFSHDENIRGDVHVHSSAILEALENIYLAPGLAAELRQGKRLPK